MEGGVTMNADALNGACLMRKALGACDGECMSLGWCGPVVDAAWRIPREGERRPRMPRPRTKGFWHDELLRASKGRPCDGDAYAVRFVYPTDKQAQSAANSLAQHDPEAYGVEWVRRRNVLWVLHDPEAGGGRLPDHLTTRKGDL
jgi:hypothetical protein